MKELQLPYIGVKIESLPTILRVVESSEGDKDFVDYYTKIGKSAKTATEYLASLRNLKLAMRDGSFDTKLTASGKVMIKEDVQNLYVSLLKHCLHHFPDLRIVKEVVVKSKVTNLNGTFDLLNSRGFIIKRKQTLSSYIKLILEGSKKDVGRKRSFTHHYEGELIEYNQFFKLVESYFSASDFRRSSLIELYLWISKKVKLQRDVYTSYLGFLKTSGRYRLIEINARAISDPNEAFKVSGRLYYYIEKTYE